MTGRYLPWAGTELSSIGRFDWERLLRRCEFRGPSTKLVALLLATWASEDGSDVRPGRERLAAAAGISHKHVSTQLGKLEEIGLIYKVHNGSSYGRRGGMASVYQLTCPSAFYEDFLKDPQATICYLVEVEIEDYKKEHVNPSAHVPVDRAGKQGNPSSGVRRLTPQEHVNSEPEQGNSEAEHVNSVPEHGNPSSPHQPITPINNHHPNNHQSSFAAESPKLTHASGPVDNSDNGSYTGSGMEDERRRQMAALQQLIDEEEKQAS